MPFSVYFFLSKSSSSPVLYASRVLDALCCPLLISRAWMRCSGAISALRFALRRVFCPRIICASCCGKSILLSVFRRTFFPVESVDALHLVDGLDAWPVALCSFLEGTDSLDQIALGFCVPHWRVSGPSFYALLLLPQWRPFGLDAVKDHFPSFLHKGLQLVHTLCLQLLFADVAPR